MGLLDWVSVIGDAVTDIGNLKAQREQLDYTKWAQKETWKREDNAVQRRVNDLRAAGLSPVLAAGSSASASAPVRVNAPQMREGAVSAALGAALELSQRKASIAQTKAQRDLIKAQAKKTEAEASFLTDSYAPRLETLVNQNRILKETTESQIKQVLQQEHFNLSRNTIERVKAWKEDREYKYKEQLYQYLDNQIDNWQTTRGGAYVNKPRYENNPLVRDYLAMTLDYELKKHDVDLYKMLPVPSGVLGSTVGTVGRLIK